MHRFTERKTNERDCRECHNGRGIWQDPVDPTFYLCDDCFAIVDQIARRPIRPKKVVQYHDGRRN